jgi:hypothetical protein
MPEKPETKKQPEWLDNRSIGPNPPAVAEVRAARELIDAWCSAYSELNSKRLADLETVEAEVIDGFGEPQYLSSRKDGERFWADGLEIIEAREFHPQCAIQHIRFLRPDVAIIQMTIAYSHGIGLKGGERIPLYSEIHTFAMVRNEGTWLITEHNIARQVLANVLATPRRVTDQSSSCAGFRQTFSNFSILRNNGESLEVRKRLRK